jgi:hypothetical protein
MLVADLKIIQDRSPLQFEKHLRTRPRAWIWRPSDLAKGATFAVPLEETLCYPAC